MTLDELRKCHDGFLTPKQVAPLIGCDPYSINLQARKDPAKLGFPVTVMGCRVRIPRLAFIRFVEGRQGA
jgi:hypothetical protein